MSRRNGIYARHRDTKVEETTANIFGQHNHADHRIRRGMWPRVQGDGRPCSLPMKRETAQRIAASLHRNPR